MPKLTRIEKELHSASPTPFEIRQGERRQSYLLRLVKSIDQLSDQEFGSMSRDAQMWTELAAQAVVKNKPIRDFEPDAEEAEEKPVARRRLPKVEVEEDVEWEDDPEPEAQPAPRTKRVKKEEEAEPAPRPRAAKKVKEVREEEPEPTPDKAPRRASPANGTAPRSKPISRRGLLPTGRNKHIQDVLAGNPNATIDEIIQYLLAQGLTEAEIPSRFSISTTRSSFRSALETMDRLKMLKKPAKLERITDTKDEG